MWPSVFVITTCLLLLFDSTTANLSPKLAESIPKKKQNVSTKLKLLCQAEEGAKPFRFEWSKNGKVLSAPEKSNIRIDSSDDDSELVIEKLATSDAGEYRCVCTNQYGEALQITQVIVKGKSR